MSRLLQKNRNVGVGARSVHFDKCNVCGKRFPNWPELRGHKESHTHEEIDRSVKPKRSGRSQQAS